MVYWPSVPAAPRAGRWEPPLVAVDNAVERNWRREAAPTLITHDRLRGVLAAMALSVPAIGMPFGSNTIALVVTGLLASAATLLLALRRDWQAPSWVAA